MKNIAIFVVLRSLLLMNIFSANHLIKLKYLYNELHIYCVKQWVLSEIKNLNK